MELEKKMADSAAGRRDEEHQKKKAEILANLTMREFVRSPLKDNCNQINISKEASTDICQNRTLNKSDMANLTMRDFVRRPKDNCSERNRTLNKGDMTKAETEGTKQGSRSTKEETENIRNSNVELVQMTSFDDSRVDEEVEILTAKAEYAREMSTRRRNNSQGAKTNYLEEDHPQDCAHSPNVGKKSILLDPNNRHSSQKVSFVEVEQQIQSLSLTDGVKRSSSGKHVTYQEDLVADSLLGEERIQNVTKKTTRWKNKKLHARRRKPSVER